MLRTSCKVFLFPYFYLFNWIIIVQSAVNFMGHGMTICPILLKLFDIAEMH